MLAAIHGTVAPMQFDFMLLEFHKGKLTGLGPMRFAVVPRVGEFIERAKGAVFHTFEVVAVLHATRPAPGVAGAVRSGDMWVIDRGENSAWRAWQLQRLARTRRCGA
jgi:hypothetical protein